MEPATSDFTASYLWVLAGVVAILVLVWLSNRLFGGGGSYRNDDNIYEDDKD